MISATACSRCNKRAKTNGSTALMLADLSDACDEL